MKENYVSPIKIENENGKYKYTLKQLSNDKENYEECINE